MEKDGRMEKLQCIDLNSPEDIRNRISNLKKQKQILGGHFRHIIHAFFQHTYLILYPSINDE